MGRLQGKVAIVTGAAKGIGAATAKALAREGAKVVCTDLDEAAGQAIADDIANEGGEATFIRHDVVNEAEWEAVAKRAEEKFGGLHVLVNNAGIAPEAGPIEEKTLESWQHTISVDLDSVFLGCKHGIRTIKKYTSKAGAGGSIINLSSILGLVGQPGASDYNAAKGGVRLLTKSAALECAGAGYNIRVNSVHPGVIDTPIWTKVTPETRAVFGGAATGNAVDPAMLAARMAPLGKAGVPDDIALGVVYLASDEARYVTGSELVIDGGATAG